MWAGIISMIGQLGLWLLSQWIRQQKKEEDMVKSYYNFLDAVDKSGSLKVANHLAAARAEQEEIERLLKEKAERENKK